MPRSSSVGDRAHRQRRSRRAPRTGARFFWSWSTASAGDRCRDRDAGSWSPAAALMISGRNRASSGEDRPTNRNSPATTGSRSVRHDSSSSLRSRTPTGAHAAMPVRRRPGRRARRKTSSSVGRTRSNAVEAHAGRHDQRQQPGEAAASSLTDTTRRPPVAAGRRPSTQARPGGVGQRRAAPSLARARARSGRAAARSGRAGRPAGPPSRAGRGPGSRPGRRSARRRSGRGWRR